MDFNVVHVSVGRMLGSPGLVSGYDDVIEDYVKLISHPLSPTYVSVNPEDVKYHLY